MTTGTAPALNEPEWLKIARDFAATKGLDKLPEDQIPPPGDGSLFVSDCLRAAGKRAPETASELAAWGQQIDPKRQVPGPGTIAIVSQPHMWRSANPGNQPTTGSKVHVGFLVRTTATTAYVLGEGVVRAFPRSAVGTYRWPS